MIEQNQKAELRESAQPSLAGELLPVAYEDLQVVRFGDTVSVFCRGFCFCTYAMSDRFCRNYCIVQLHIAGGVQLRRLSRLFDLGYQQCSNIVSRYRKGGISALLERTQKRYLNRCLIDEEIGEFIWGLRDAGKSYKEISEAIRFQFKKKVAVQSIRAWVHRSRKNKLSRKHEVQLEMFDEGLCVSTREGTGDTIQGNISKHFSDENGCFTLSGWAIDPEKGEPAREVILVHDNRVIAWTTPGLPRPDVAAARDSASFLNSGWELRPHSGLLTTKDMEIKAYAVFQDKLNVGQLVSTEPLRLGLRHTGADTHVLQHPF